MSKFPSLFDPWAKRDAWRRHPVFSNRAMFSSLFPGFGIAVVAFSAYVLAENILGKGKHQAVGDKHH
ncbi:NADH-ubiquinone oxidoreductase B12 subunit family-domain-containing protein [Russula aff. rugulosa BPL654]|nr:NADH-ubiquinone oxidoreductase B12 subunit family-domain-containing protein [Russula aff. rugulosa BPL654]